MNRKLDVLEQIRAAHGFPLVIGVDQRSEINNHDFSLRAYQKGVVLDFLRARPPNR